MRRPSWKLVGLAGLAGVAATGVVVARRRRAHVEYDAAELRDRLHRRLAEVETAEPGGPHGAPDPDVRGGGRAEPGGPRGACDPDARGGGPAGP
jgi:hypothetical protein